jgi:hypothetical protein
MHLYDISNHPQDSNISRKAGRAGILTQEYHVSDQLYVYLNILIKHYKDGQEYPLIPDYIFTLRATNSTFVNYMTGEFVESTHPNAMGEADFFINVVSGLNSSIDSLSEGKILQADSYNRFDDYTTAIIVSWM